MPVLKRRGRSELVDGKVFRRLVVQFEFAVAAIAASAAAVTQMIGAGVLSAVRADARRFGLADTADEYRWCHFGVLGPIVFVDAVVFLTAVFAGVRTGG